MKAIWSDLRADACQNVDAMGSQCIGAINLCKIGGVGLNKDTEDDGGDVAVPRRRCGDNIISRSREVIEWVEWSNFQRPPNANRHSMPLENCNNDPTAFSTVFLEFETSSGRQVFLISSRAPVGLLVTPSHVMPETEKEFARSSEMTHEGYSRRKRIVALLP